MRSRHKMSSSVETPASAITKDVEVPTLSMFGDDAEPTRRGSKLYFFCEVQPKATSVFLADLTSAVEDAAKFNFEHQVGQAVDIYINSLGGDLYGGLAMYDTIRRLSSARGVPIHTHVVGMAASAATLIAVAGTHRTIGASSFMLVHQYSALRGGTHEQLSDFAENGEKCMKLLTRIYKDRTNLTGKQVKRLLQRDLALTAKECLKCGLVDEQI